MSQATPRVLLVEDSPLDAELIREALEAGGLEHEMERVESEDALAAALEGGGFDVILSDYSLPGFSGTEALELARARAPETPFVFVSGTIGEEAAVEGMQSGAVDYVLKQRLQRLTPVVRRALREAGERRQRQRLEEQLRQAQRLELVGYIAGGVAHDFNNMLMVMQAHARLLLETLGPGEAREHAEAIVEVASRAAALAGQLLNFRRRAPSRVEPLEVDPWLRGLLGVIRPLLGGRIQIEPDLAAPGAWVAGDRDQLERAVLNLAVNARDAMSGGGVLAIGTRAEALPDGAPGVRLTIRDTGCGIDPGILARIFEPLFTTKEAGSGLGLAIVREAVEQAGGTVEVESRPGAGTAFHLTLPRPAPAPAGRPAPAVTEPPPGRGERVMIVEDNAILRELLVESLEAEGYRVLEARDGGEALALCERHPGPVDLLVADYEMPGMTGTALAGRIRAIHPRAKVLLISGHSLETAPALAGADRLLTKPFTPEDLLGAMREILDVACRAAAG
jgi:signal transduction histidine kinase